MLTPQMAIADVLFEHDDLTIEQIIERAEIALTYKQVLQILIDAERRGHVIHLARKLKPLSYSLTMFGRQASPLICSAKVLLRANRRLPRIVANNGAPIPSSAEPLAEMPKHLLRVLALAARDSGLELKGDLREAVERALSVAA
jgi:hypothetical protein